MKGFDLDSIAAIVTPVGEGGVGVVRISGEASLPILKKICKPKVKIVPYKIYLGWAYVHKNVSRGTFLADEVLYTYFKGPKSYTGEDVVEISCHGGIAISHALLDEAIRYGARLAERGEFTKRAFLNGKIDIAQAESILSLIKAKNKVFVERAAIQLKGKLSEKINALYGDVLGLIALIEAWVDFSDDVNAPKITYVRRKVKALIKDIERMLNTADLGKILRQGIKAVIVGKPNVGKSSLLNALIGEERAIVSQMPGTTRDVIEESINLGEIVLSLSDTAGLGKTNCEIEIAGIERAKAEIERAELIIFVNEALNVIGKEEVKLLQKLKGKKIIVVLNKMDLMGRKKPPAEIWLKREKIPFVKTSLLIGRGLKELRDKIKSIFINSEMMHESKTVIITSRHKGCLQKAQDKLYGALGAVAEGKPIDLAAIDLREAAMALGEVTGKAISENIIDRIFNEFCVGK